MKKFILLIAALAATCTLAFAENEAAGKTFQQHYDFRDFSKLSVSNSFRVDLHFTDNYSVDIEVPDFLEPYLKISCVGGKLSIGLTNLPQDIQRKLNDHSGELYAKVEMPSLTALTMSGATRVATTGVPRLGDSESLSVDMSGASVLENLEASSKGRLTVDLSGASKAAMKAQFHVCDIDLSGACHLKLEGNADKVSYDGSGASDCALTGNYGEVASEISGSSSIQVKGDVRSLDASASGSSKFEVEGDTEKADVELSGASKGRLTVTQQLKYELSGVSTLKVKDKGIATKHGQASRSAKVEFVR